MRADGCGVFSGAGPNCFLVLMYGVNGTGIPFPSSEELIKFKEIF